MTENSQFRSYSILDQIGLGGMAAVYLANHKTLGHHVAIKVLNKEFTFNQNIRSRFIAEAKKMVRMNHPNVVKVTDLIDEENTVAIVMEYVDGKNLIALSAEHKFTDEEIELYLKQMLQALSYIHNQGLIHRDIKPSNFILGKDGRLKLTDFGISKSFLSNSDFTQTSTSMSLGTPMYMSPEQVRSTKDVTQLTDIYSLGVVLWQLVSGQKPYNSETTSAFDLQLKIVQEDLPLTHTTWDKIIQKATQKDERIRYQSADEFLMAVENQEIVEDDFERTVSVENKVSKIEQKNVVNRKKINFKKSFLFITIILTIIFLLTFRFLSNESHKDLNPYLNDLYINNLKGKVKQLTVSPDATHNKGEVIEFEKNNLFCDYINHYPSSFEYSWNFNEKGNHISVDPNDKTTTKYDQFDKLIFSGSKSSYSNNYIYNRDFKCVKIIRKNNNHLTGYNKYKYDVNNNLTNLSRYHKDDNSSHFCKTEFCKIEYDSKGKVKFEERRSFFTNTSLILNYFYNNNGILYLIKASEKKDNRNTLYTLKYNDKGDIFEASYDIVVPDEMIKKYSFNKWTKIHTFEYEYDNFGNWTKRTILTKSIWEYIHKDPLIINDDEFNVQYREIEYYE